MGAARNKVATSQLALPPDVCDAVSELDGYEGSRTTHRRTSLDSDLVFRDGHQAQMATVSGDVDHGLVAELTIPIGGAVR